MRFLIQGTTLAALMTVFVASSASAAPDLSRAQALSRLKAGTTADKAPPALLERLLDESGGSFIVEYLPDELPPPEQRSANTPEALRSIKRASFAAAKNSVDKAGISTIVLKEYDMLPLRFVQTRSREALLKLLEHRQVKAIYPNTPHEFQLAESLPEIGFYEAMVWGNQYKGQGTTVAVLDSGIDYTRAAFGNCTAPGVPASCRVVAAFDAAADDAALDDLGHGTLVSGIVAGVSPQTRLAVLDVGTLDGWRHVIRPADVLSSLNWVLQNKTLHNIVAINMSFTTVGGNNKNVGECTASQYTSTFKLLRDANILPVVATGNSGWTDGLPEPACVPGAVRVGATYDANVGPKSYSACTDATTTAGQIACFSNAGATLLAPGAMVGAAGRAASAGTSLAAPHVAAAIAVLRGSAAGSLESSTDTIFRLRSSAWRTVDTRTGKPAFALDLGQAVESLVRGLPPIH